MNSVVSQTEEPDSGYPRLERQIEWYDSRSRSSQKLFKNVKMVEFFLGALVPLTATWFSIATALLGVAVIVLEGAQQLFQWQHNWITYRSTCEALRHEKYTYIERAGVYNELDEVGARKLLVERVEALISTEHAKWISRQEYDSTAPKKGS